MKTRGKSDDGEFTKFACVGYDSDKWVANLLRLAKEIQSYSDGTEHEKRIAHQVEILLVKRLPRAIKSRDARLAVAIGLEVGLNVENLYYQRFKENLAYVGLKRMASAKEPERRRPTGRRINTRRYESK